MIVKDLLPFPWIVVVVKEPLPLLSNENWETFDVHNPNVSIAVSPMRFVSKYSLSRLMSLEDADKCTWWKEDRKICLVLIQLVLFIPLILGLMAANMDTPSCLRWSIIDASSSLSPESLNECCVFCMQILRILVGSIGGMGVPKGCKWSKYSWRGWEGKFGGWMV